MTGGTNGPNWNVEDSSDFGEVMIWHSSQRKKKGDAQSNQF